MRHVGVVIARIALWSAVGLVLLVGLAQMIKVMAGGGNNNANAGERIVERAPTWPNSAARDLAVQFTRDYWTLDPDRPDRYDDTLATYTPDSLATSIVPTWPRDTALKTAAPAIADEHVVPGKKQRVLITVSAKVTQNKSAPRVMYLTVPVAKDDANGVVVYDYPSLSAGPARGSDQADAVDALPTGEQVELDGTLTRFFTAYLAGDTPGLEYFTRPGVVLHALPNPLKLRTLGAFGLTAPPKGNVRELAVNLTATSVEPGKDDETPITFPLRYRLRMEHGDRWYVAAINEGGS